jgi:hypothetical protein
MPPTITIMTKTAMITSSKTRSMTLKAFSTLSSDGARCNSEEGPVWKALLVHDSL